MVDRLYPVLGKGHADASVEHGKTFLRDITDICISENATWHFLACEKRISVPMPYPFHGPQRRVLVQGIGPPDRFKQ